MILNIPLTSIIVYVVIMLFIIFAIFMLNLAEIVNTDRKNHLLVNSAVSFIIAVLLFGGFFLYYNNTESGKRSSKTWQSNIEGGITRQVRVYDMDGDLLEEYTGKFDIEFNDSERILFDDENGKRHVIYFKTGTVIVDEIDE